MEPFQCILCNMWFATFGRYKRHVLRHKKKYATLRRTNKTPQGQVLTDLVKTHIADKPFKCTQCSKNYIRKSSLNEHYKMHHMSECACLCLKCGHSFVTQEELDRHAQLHVTEKMFRCPQCDKGFSHHLSFTSHLKKHIGDTPFGCHLCAKAFTSKGYLKSHLKSHSEERAYRCDYCNNAYKHKSALNVHLKSHFTAAELLKKFKCHHCGRGFARKSSRNRHVLTHAKAKPFPCSKCGLCFTDRSSLMYHIFQCQTEKFGKSMSSPVESNANSVSFEDSKEGRIFENILLPSSTNPNVATSPLVPVTLTCSPSNEEVEVAQREPSIQSNHANSTSFCNQAYHDSVRLTQPENSTSEHVVISNADSVSSTPSSASANSTPSCDAVKEKAYNHIDNEQTTMAISTNVGQSTNTVPTVDKPISVSSAYQVNSNPPFIPQRPLNQSTTCPCCKKSFSGNSYLVEHLRTHTGEKPFQCQFCAKRFTQKFYLKVHLKSHSENREFKCEHCSNSYKHKSALNEHLKNHYFADEQLRKFKCPECGKGFARTTTLKRHILTHNGAMPLQCSQCKLFFTQQSAFEIHRMTCKKANALYTSTLLAAAANLSRAADKRASLSSLGGSVLIPAFTVFTQVPQLNQGLVIGSRPSDSTPTAATIAATVSSINVTGQGQGISGELLCDSTLSAQAAAVPCSGVQPVKTEEKQIAHSMQNHNSGNCDMPLTTHSIKVEDKSNLVPTDHTLNRLNEKDNPAIMKQQEIQSTPAFSIAMPTSLSTAQVSKEEGQTPGQILGQTTHQFVKMTNHNSQHKPVSASLMTSSDVKPDDIAHRMQAGMSSIAATTTACPVKIDNRVTPTGSISSAEPIIACILANTPTISATPDNISSVLQDRSIVNPTLDSFVDKVSQNECPFCSKCFAAKAYLEAHLRVHTGEKPFHCHLCPKRFTQKIYLRSHLKMHTDERDFKCDHCNNSYKHRSSLNVHLKSHQFTEEELKTNKCPHCDKGFRRKTSLRRHILTHNGNY